MKSKKLTVIAALLMSTLSALAVAGDLKPWNPPDYFAPVKYAQLEGMKIAYLEAGEQNPTAILFIHGFTGDAQNWWDQYEYFKDKYHVVVIDNPGHGKSERRADIEYSMELDAKVAKELLDYLKIEKAVVVGNSMGGHIAALVAIRYPEKVEKLVLVDAAGAMDLRWLVGLKPLINGPMIGAVLKPTSGNQYIPENGRVPERRAHPMSLAGTAEAPLYLDALADSIKSLALDSIKGELKNIKAETLIIWGDNDPTVPPRNVKTFQRLIPKTTVYWVHNGGHTPQMNKPAEFNCALEAWIEGRCMKGCEGK